MWSFPGLLSSDNWALLAYSVIFMYTDLPGQQKALSIFKLVWKRVLFSITKLLIINLNLLN